MWNRLYVCRNCGGAIDPENYEMHTDEICIAPLQKPREYDQIILPSRFRAEIMGLGEITKE